MCYSTCPEVVVLIVTNGIVSGSAITFHVLTLGLEGGLCRPSQRLGLLGDVLSSAASSHWFGLCLLHVIVIALPYHADIPS